MTTADPKRARRRLEIAELERVKETLEFVVMMLGKVQGALRDTPTAREAYLEFRPLPHNARTLERAREFLLGATRDLLAASQGVGTVAGSVEQELGLRHRPGRPPELSSEEYLVATYMRAEGGVFGKRASWKQTLDALNEKRPPNRKLSLETLRTALKPRYVKKPPRLSRMR
jgi:hypothetical protein